jgi:hypothetical protein
MHHQIVRPAGAERETGWVLLASGLILAAAVVAVGLRPAAPAGPVLAAHQVESRTGLTAAEQGLYADLKVAGEEIEALRQVAGRAPAPLDLATEALPPFAADSSAAARGGHGWSLMETGRGAAYVGVSAAPETAGSLVLLLDGHGAEVWLKRAAEAPPAALDEAALIGAGWKQVTSTFEAGVTR